jgi:hypothetical protein
VLLLVGNGSKPATMPITVPVLRVLETCRGERTTGPLVLRPQSGKPVDRRDVNRMVRPIATIAKIPRHISPYSLRHAAIINALDPGVPLPEAQILACHADPRTTECCCTSDLRTAMSAITSAPTSSTSTGVPSITWPSATACTDVPDKRSRAWRRTPWRLRYWTRSQASRSAAPSRGTSTPSYEVFPACRLASSSACPSRPT